MPILILIILAAAVFGALGHSNAKKKYKKAKEISDKAEEIYNEAKTRLEIAKKKSEDDLLTLGYSKKNILKTSIKDFLKNYDKIKKVRFNLPETLNEFKNFNIEEKDALQLIELSDIYEKNFSTGAAGAATGGVMALAAGGSLSLVSGGLGIAGTALSIGQVGLAASFAGAALTPLAVVVAPIVLFTGVSSFLKADENLRKARAMKAKATLAVEKMETSIIFCDIISEKSEMFNSLLQNLNFMLLRCNILLTKITKKHTGFFKGETIDIPILNDEEKKIFAMSRSLCGAIKSIIDAPILNNEGKIHEKSEEIYELVNQQAVIFEEKAKEIKSYNEIIHLEEVKLKTIPVKLKSILLLKKLLSFFLVLILALGIYKCYEHRSFNIVKILYSEINKTYYNHNYFDEEEFLSNIKEYSYSTEYYSNGRIKSIDTDLQVIYINEIKDLKILQDYIDSLEKEIIKNNDLEYFNVLIDFSMDIEDRIIIEKLDPNKTQDDIIELKELEKNALKVFQKLNTKIKKLQ